MIWRQILILIFFYRNGQARFHDYHSLCWGHILCYLPTICFEELKNWTKKRKHKHKKGILWIATCVWAILWIGVQWERVFFVKEWLNDLLFQSGGCHEHCPLRVHICTFLRMQQICSVNTLSSPTIVFFFMVTVFIGFLTDTRDTQDRL